MSWEQLEGILKENREVARRESIEPPVVCPFDGHILDVHPSGVRNCPFGNYTWRGGPRLI